MTTTARKLRRVGAATAVLTAVFAAQAGMASAATNVSVVLSDSRPSITNVNHEWTWTNSAAATIACVSVEFDLAADGTGGMPAGMSLTGATFSGYGGAWTLDATSAGSGIAVFNATTAVSRATGTTSFTVGGVTNATAAGTKFMSVTTYSTAGAGTTGTCGGSVVDAATVAAFAVVDGQAVTVAVDPSLTFTVGNTATGTVCNGVTSNRATTTNAINLGRLQTISQRATGVQNLTVVTNASGGYNVYASYTGQLAGVNNGARLFANVSGTHAAPAAYPADGTEAFGYTVGDTTDLTGFASSAFAALETTNRTVMTASSVPGTSGDTNCIAFQASMAGNTPADSYTTTVRYSAAPRF